MRRLRSCRFFVAAAVAIAVAVVTLVAGCAEFPITPPPDDTDSMRRTWGFSTMSLVDQQDRGWSSVGDVRRQQGGTVFDQYVFGPAALDLSDGEATGEVRSSESGFRHGVLAEAPYEPSPPDSTRPIGGRTTLRQYQRFEKTEANASLLYAVTGAYLEAIDTNDRPVTEFECPWQSAGDPSLLCNRVLWAWVTLDIEVMRVPLPATCAEASDDCLFRANGRADLFGWFDNWDMQVMSNGLQPTGMWRADDFRLEESSNDDFSHARVLMNNPVVMDIPLDDVAIGDTIQVAITVESAALNHRQDELEAFVFAHVREAGGGEGLEFTHNGLEPIETPQEEDGMASVATGAITQCGTAGGGTPDGGAVEFVSDAFHSAEWPVGRAPVVLQRTGGNGPVSVLLTTSDGTATAGDDYEELSVYVVFDGRPDETRAIDIPILGDDAVEGHETLEVQLSSPSCGTLGSRTNATFTIYDDDREGAPSYSVGGIVVGLAGSDLEISNQGRRHSITQNGPFEFPGGWPAGMEYDVVVTQQPTDPAQACTVANGTGTIGSEDVVNVQVTCETTQTAAGLDTGFGDGGRVYLASPPDTDDRFAAKLTLHDDGILVLGRYALTRYHMDGSIDASFGTGGAVDVEFHGGNYDDPHAVAVQSNGSILVAGSTMDGANSPVKDDFALVRYDANGTRDTSFGVDGLVTTDFAGWPDAAYDILLQPDGAIVLAGIAHNVDQFGATDADFALVRYTSDGVPDSTFGVNGDGRASVDVAGRSDTGYAAALLADGSIVIVGRAATSGGSNPDIGIARFGADGILDPNFGDQGVVFEHTTEADEATDVVIDAAGRILVSGSRTFAAARHALVARYTSDGTADGAFGTGGVATNTLVSNANGLALDAAGGIVIVGASGQEFGVVRLHDDGSTATEFGADGVLTADFFGSFDHASDVVIQPDGRIVVTGMVRNGIQRHIGLIRVVP